MKLIQANKITPDGTPGLHALIITCAKQNEYHQENMHVKCIPLSTPLLYSKGGVYRGIPIFLIFAPKHRLWVLVRTVSVLTCTHNLTFEQK